MNCAAPPLHEIEVVNTLSNLSSDPVGSWFTALTVMHALPKLAKRIADSFPNDRLKRMSHEDAKELYLPLTATHRALMGVIDRVERRFPLLFVTVLRGWARTMTTYTERIGDVAEALAWSSDESLKAQLAEAVHQVEQRNLQLTQ